MTYPSHYIVMNKIIFITVLSLLAIMANAQQPQEEDRIKQVVINAFDSIWSALNVDAMKAYYTDDFLLLEDGRTWNTDSISRFFRDVMIPRVQSLKKENRRPERINRLRFIRVSVSDTLAWMAYHNTAEFKIDGKTIDTPHWLESAVLVKRENMWKIQLLHASIIHENKNENDR